MTLTLSNHLAADSASKALRRDVFQREVRDRRIRRRANRIERPEASEWRPGTVSVADLEALFHGYGAALVA